MPMSTLPEAASQMAAQRPAKPERRATRARRDKAPSPGRCGWSATSAAQMRDSRSPTGGAVGEMTILPTSDHPSFEHAVRA